MKSTVCILLLTALISCTPGAPGENVGIFGSDRLRSVAAQDGVTPIPIDDEFTVWTFGDTLLWKNGREKGTVNIGEHLDDLYMTGNSIALSSGSAKTDVKGTRFDYYKQDGRPAELIPTKAAGNIITKHWPAGGIYLDTVLYIFAYRVQFDTEKGFSDFKIEGVSLLKAVISPERENFTLKNSELINLFAQNRFVLGDSVTMADNILYLAGRAADEKGAFTSVFLARVLPDKIEDPSSYSFLSETGWTDQQHKSTIILENITGEYSLFFESARQRYIITYCDTSGSIKTFVFRYFDRLNEGRGTIIYRPQSLAETGRPFNFYYSGKQIHSDRKYHYSIYIHPVEYQPYLLKTPYSKIRGMF